MRQRSLCCDQFIFAGYAYCSTPQVNEEKPKEYGQPGHPQVEYWQQLIGLDAAKAIGMCRRDVVVGVIDSGIAYDHPALQPNIWTNLKEVPGNGVDDDGNGYIDDVHGYNFIDRNGDPRDDLGHGTHVAGIIGAVPGHTRACGVCQEISIAALRFMNKHGAGTIATAIEALNYAVQMGFQVSCNSWGGPGFSLLLKRAIAQAHRANHLFVTAAGNRGLPVDFLPEFPAALALANIITVAATDEHDRLAQFSNYGALSVHLTAPGVNIHSTFPPQTSLSLSGTSMATPIVAAVSAMLYSLKPKPVEKVRRAILSSVDKIPQLWSKLQFAFSGDSKSNERAVDTVLCLSKSYGRQEQQKQGGAYAANLLPSPLRCIPILFLAIPQAA